MTQHGAPTPIAWHARPTGLARFLVDLMAEELQRLRPNGWDPPSLPWSEALFLDERGLGLDSLERMTVAAVIAEALHLHESGIEDLLLAKGRWGEWLEIAANSLLRFDSALTFRTSGSTGVPKACTHSLDVLRQEVEYLGTVFGSAERMLVAVPSHHIYGFLFSILLSERLNCAAVIDVRRMVPQTLRQLMRSEDLVVSHPAHWALLARHALKFPARVVGVTSSAPCPPELAGRLAEAGLQRLVQVCGSTETGGLGWREVALGPYQLMPFWSREPGAGGSVRRTLPDGSTRLYPLQDELEWRSSRSFRIGARLDNAVQVGGVNVFPNRVRRMLLAHPWVEDAVVRLMSPLEGSRLKAFIVPKPEAPWAELGAELERWVQSRLAAAERPRSFTMGARLPVSDRSKPIDWPVR